MTVTELMSEEQRRAMRYLSAIEFVRKEKADMPVYMLAILILTKKTPGIALKDMEAALGMTASAVVRNVQNLSVEGYIKPNKERTEGLGLVETYNDPIDTRVKRAKLTKRGEIVFREFDRILKGS